MLPALLPIVSQIAIVAPGVISGMVQVVAANVATRVAYERIVSRSNVDNVALQAIASALKDPSSGANLANIALAARDELSIIKNRLITSGEGDNITDIVSELETQLSYMQEILGSMSDNIAIGLKAQRDFEGVPVDIGLAQILDEKPFGIVDSTLQINIQGLESMLNDYSETWTIY